MVGQHTEPMPLEVLIPHVKTKEIGINMPIKTKKKIAIDLDNTLVGSKGQLRTGAKEFLQKLKDDGHELTLWTHSGKRRANEIITKNGIKEYFDNIITRENYAEGKGQYTFKDIRKTGHDILIDNSKTQQKNFEKEGIGDKYIKVSPYKKGKSVGAGLKQALEKIKDNKRQKQH